MTFQFKKKKKLCKGLCRKSSLCIKLMFVCDYMQMSSTRNYRQNGVKINKTLLKVYTTQELISAYLKSLSKYRIEFFFLKYLFSF